MLIVNESAIVIATWTERRLKVGSLASVTVLVMMAPMGTNFISRPFARVYIRGVGRLIWLVLITGGKSQPCVQEEIPEL